MSGFDPAAAGWRVWAGGALDELLGGFWSKREGEGWAYGLLATEAHRNRQGVVHGGVQMSFLDHCLGVTAWEAAGRSPVATIQLNTNFVSAVKVGEFIEARAEVVRAARSVVFMRGALTVEGRVAATADGVWKRIGL